VTVRFLVLAILLSVLPAPTIAQAADGILITQRVTSGGAPLTVQVQIEPTRMRTEMAGPDGVMNVTIFDGGKQVLYIVDPARKTYVEMTKADVDRLGAQMQGAMAQMQSQLEKLPPAQRAQMEAMMKGKVNAVALQPTGSDKVGRWTCDKYDVTQGGQKIGEVCNVNPKTLGFGAADFDVMRQMGAFYSAMAPLMPSQLPGVSGIDQGGSSGFPVRTIMLVPGQSATTEVIEAARQTFPDSLFAVPAGFTKQDVAALMGGTGPGR
jgi:hypothetical protein